MRINLSYPLSLGEIAAMIGVTLENGDTETVITALTTDSREVEEGDLFVALVGERADGNDYLPRVFELGAAAAISARREGDHPVLLHGDSTVALGLLAKGYAQKIPHKTVAVTGSIGKTTTKECLRAVLSESFRIHATEGNLNNELGLPYTILSMPRDTEILILEMGMSGLGEIAYLSKIAAPDVGIITTIGTSHLEHLGSRENICRAKMEITEGMKEGSILLLNGDEPLLAAHKSHPLSPRMISFSEGEYTASDLSVTSDHTAFRAVLMGKALPEMSIPLPGKHAAAAALFALAVGDIFGMTPSEMQRGLAAYKSSGLRQSTIKTTLDLPHGKLSLTVLRDCYNAAPESMRAALDVLKITAAAEGGRAIAFLGDMKELGENTRALHESVGEYAKKLGIHMLITYGPLARHIADGALSAGMPPSAVHTLDFPDTDTAAEFLCRTLNDRDTVLFKASRAMKVETVAERLLS